MSFIEITNEALELNPELKLDFEIGKGIKNLMNGKDLYYHIYVTNDMIRIDKEGYNTPCIESFEYNLSNLDDELKKAAVIIAYYHTFLRTGDLLNRMNVISKDFFADTHNGSKHAFYHDRTSLYPESDIVERLFQDNSSLKKIKSVN